ncbi:MAG TPA: DUF6600 domain-containing protein [Terriglobales bacterium]|nr:DUF6600 domain-containing protein [Terriglobales bacterium]
MRRLWMLALIGCLGTAMLGAQDQEQAPPPPADAQTAPVANNSTVARLSAISGTVSTQRGDTGEWETGAVNTPLVSGDKVAAGDGGRAEIQLDYADLLRLSNNSQANLVSLDNNQFQVQLASGTADYVVLNGAQATSEVDTPNIALHPQGAGVFRIEVVSDQETDVIVRQGEAEISTPQGSTPLKEGQMITVQGTDAPQYKIGDAPAEDAWDHWNTDRDHAVSAAVSVQHTNPYYTGVQDLDQYGYWTVVPSYGQVWVPNDQGPNWTPYSNGRWDWEPGWGWTWVDYSPWGWAPYHYGRWFLYGARWSWWPGPVTPYFRPVWAPAYVSFYGWNGGFGFGFGFGSVGWLPIGPCDPFRPWWHGGFGFGFRGGLISPLAVVGRGRIRYSNLDLVATNARIRGALIRVPSHEFGRGGIAGREHVSVAEFNRRTALDGRMPAPTRASLGVGRPIASRAALPRSTATHFFGERGGVAAHSSFSAERGRSFAPATRGNVAPAARGNFAAGRTEAGAAARGSVGGWQRFSARPEGGATGRAAVQGQARSGFTAPRGNGGGATSRAPQSGGWQRFTPQSRGAEQAPRGNFSPAGRSPEMARPQFNAPRPQYNAPRPQYSAPRPEYRGGGNARPPLQMGHPIVQAPRGNYGGGGRMSAPRPSYSGGGGGRVSAPRGGGGGGGSHGRH